VKLHWGHYCLLVGTVLAIIQVLIAFNPPLDWTFTPIKVFNRPLYLTHNYVEMVGLFLFGIGLAKTFQKHSRYVEVGIWLYLGLYAIGKALESNAHLLYVFLAVLLLGFPFPLGFYLYKFYRWQLSEKKN